ncbi:MAG: TolC family protein [Bacteroidetes bacterium]|nr:TolC family protein [Bacteroidota bacterium]
MRRLIIPLILFISLSGGPDQCKAEVRSFSDTLRLKPADAEKLFLEQNLSLLAERCNVDAARAMIIQARLYSNPNLTIEQGVYDPDSKKLFDVEYTGNTGFTLQQLFYLAGKRDKRIRIEQLNTERQEDLFYDLLRSLRYQLKNDFNTLYFKQQTLKVFDKELAPLNKLVEVYKEQNKKGFVSDKELARLQASQFSLENERLSLSNEITDLDVDLGILLHRPGCFIMPELNEKSTTPAEMTAFPLQALIDTAMQNRADLKAAEHNVKWNEANLAFQKSLAIPDFTLQADYSRQGSYVRDYNAITLGIDLPFFNKNQGNIKAAKFQADNSKYMLQLAEDNVKGDVIQAYNRMLQNENLYKSFDLPFYRNFDKLLEEVTLNFEKKNISLLEFLDFYEAYKDNQVQLNTFLNNRLDTFEELNFSVGKNIISY